MKPRKHIAGLGVYSGEITVDKLAAKIGKASTEIIKAEFNENLHPPSANVVKALNKFLDTNQSKYGKINSYPYDITYENIRNKLAKSICKNFSYKNVILGNGSNEIIDLVIKTFVDPAANDVLLMAPVFGGYNVYLKTYCIQTNTIICNKNLSFDVDDIEKAITPVTKVVFICHPNNPTGLLFSREKMVYLLENYPEILFFVDEAYITFSPEDSFFDLVHHHGNIVISRTFSKACSLAGLRIGYAISSEDNIEWLSRTRVSYTANIVSIIAIDALLSDHGYIETVVREINSERETMKAGLQKIPHVLKIYDSKSNFILVKFKEALKLFDFLLQNGIIVRNYTKAPKLDGCLRISICRRHENEKILEIIRNFRCQQ